MLKSISAYWSKYRYWRKDRAWKRSPRRAELDAERDLPPRPLTEEEDRLLCWMLEHGTDFAKSFLPQIEGIRAARSCICGCPSIRLVVADDAPLGRIEPSRLAGDFLGNTAKGELVGLLLFANGGKLSGLEVYSLDGQIDDAGNEFGLPMLESLSEWKTEEPKA